MPPRPAAPERDVDRLARIAAIRAEIAAGTYETVDKMQAALAAFLSGGRDGRRANEDESPGASADDEAADLGPTRPR
ncbi:MAG: hypothetical protein K8T25_23615 [Planctomycetia bacterium]|nr:hypothetical protein [Planctomycetia bacterium]